MTRILSFRWWRERNKVSSPPRRRTIRPAVEALEVRDLLSASDGGFVGALYQTLVGRTPDSSVVAYWTGQLGGGVSRTQVALSVLDGTEYQGREVQGVYQQALGRAASPGEANYWVQAMQNGANLHQVEAGVLGSDAFFNQAGGTADGFLRALYADVLHRGLDASGASFFGAELAAGQPRSLVAYQVIASAEAEGIEVSNLYQQVLGRAPDSYGLGYWVNLLQHGTSSTALQAGLLGSDEFYARQGGILAAAAPAPGPAPAPTAPANPATTTGDPTGTSLGPVEIMIQGLQGSGYTTRFLTTNPRPTVYGSATPGTSLVVSVGGVQEGDTQAAADGSWSFTLTRALAEGPNQVTVAAQSAPYSQTATVTLDTTPPAVTLQAPEFATYLAPQITVQATDANGVSPQVHIDVDLKHDGLFTDPGDQDYATGVLNASGQATLTLTPLPEGTFTLRARVADVLGNVGVGTATMQVDPNAGFIGSQGLLDLAYGLPYGTPVSVTAPTHGQYAPPPGGTGPTPHGPGQTGPGGSTYNPAKDTPWEFDSSGRVLVSARATLGKYLSTFEQGLQNLGMRVTSTAPDQNLVIGYLPIDKILSMPQVPYFDAATPVPKPKTQVGSVTTEGDAVILADQFRASQHVDGSGVKVGVLSDSVNQFLGGLADSVRTGDLPNNVQVLEDGPPGSTDEGRAMLEIVHDVAPGAALAFHTGFISPQDFAAGIHALANAGAKVEADDIGYFDSPMFNDGVIAKAVDSVVTQQGVFYTSAAGNNGNFGWQDVWRGKSTSVGGVQGTFENFGGGNVLQTFTLNPGDEVVISFQWDSAFLEGGSPLPNYRVPNDVAALVTNADGSQVLQTFDNNALNTGEANQIIDFVNDGTYGTNQFALAFQLTAGPAPGHLRWVNETDGLDIHALDQGGPTVFGQPAARHAVAVGAVYWGTPDQPESFTSLGSGLQFFFDQNGNRLAAPEVRNKPEVTGPDGVTTSFFPDPSDPVFFGTSAATPHVAAAAALLLQQAPGATPLDLAQHLEQTAKDIPPAGFDGLTGFGLIQLKPLLLLSPDRFESNNTSDKATDFGTLFAGTQDVSELSIVNQPNGLPDYDWYRWSMGQGGTFTVKENTTQTQGEGNLELHLFTLQGNTLVQLSFTTVTGIGSATLSTPVSADQPILVEVKGQNSSPGVQDQAAYDLEVTLS